jgi:hypothetical protein
MSVKNILAAGLALTIGATSLVTTADARHRRHHGDAFIAGALGFTAGAFFGSALAPRHRYYDCYDGYSYYCDDYPRAYYYDEPRYYAPAPRYYAPAPRVYYRNEPRYDDGYGYDPCDMPTGVSKPAHAMC